MKLENVVMHASDERKVQIKGQKGRYKGQFGEVFTQRLPNLTAHCKSASAWLDVKLCQVCISDVALTTTVMSLRYHSANKYLNASLFSQHVKV